jgi:hypothetical protein
MDTINIFDSLLKLNQNNFILSCDFLLAKHLHYIIILYFLVIHKAYFINFNPRPKDRSLNL